MKRILPYLKPYRGKMLLGMLLIAVSSVCSLLLPTIMSDILDGGIYTSDWDYILRCCGRMLLVTLLSLGAVAAGTWCRTQVVSGFCADLRAAVFGRVNALTFEEVSRIGTSALLTRSTHDVGTLAWVADMLSSNIITIPVLFFGGVILALRKDVTMSLILLLFVPAIFLIVRPISKRIGPLHETSDKYIDIQNDVMRERLHGIRVIRAFNKEASLQQKIADATHVMAENIINANVQMGLLSPAAVLLVNLAGVAILWLGGWRMETGSHAISGGDIFAIIQYLALVANGVLMGGFAMVMLPHAKVAADRIGEIFHATGMQETAKGAEHTFGGEITFDHVTFRYEGASEAAVQDVSMHILPGQKIAIVGPTGAGKSTMVKLLMRFYDVSGGRILIDGRDIREFDRDDLRRLFGMVLQDTWLFEGTIADNIRYGRLDATDAEVEAAARAAHADHFIRTLPGGYRMVVNEESSNVSQGQKQLLTIARAILADPKIMILDEATSSVDTRTEVRIQKGMDESMKGRTSFIIAHRLSTIRNADLILVMRDGDIVEQGTHEALMEKGGFYREIYQAQFSA